MENKSHNVNQPLTIDDIINEIKSKSEDGDYIYRGERKSPENILRLRKTWEQILSLPSIRLRTYEYELR